jgi:hypothetical protein
VKARGWLWFAVVQLISLIAMVIGWVLLIPFCVAHAWVPIGSIDRWTWSPLNWMYGNPEDGVSGQYARIWNSTGTALVRYMPNASAAWRSYCWSAWRNSCNNLKYVFAHKDGPFWRREFGKFYVQAGFYPNSGFPVLSAGSM